MYAVHVEMKIKSGEEAALVKTFHEFFRPAISRQEGFKGVSLLKPFDGKGDYRLTIDFESRELQQKWVAKDLHQDVWPRMESHAASCVIGYYNSV